MKSYLLDTNIASALWDELNRNHDDALRFVQSAALSSDFIYVSRITVAEIEYGYKLYASKHPDRRRKADEAMRAFKAIKEIGKDTTEPYSDIRAALFTRFAPRDSKDRIRNVRPETMVDKTTAVLLGIQENDLWIAAIAIEYNMILVSGDRMNRIREVWPGLRLVNWTS
ncbi:MAG: type II toxin-antitoxin system VapC family toxin [Acidobacteriota bacterium]